MKEKIYSITIESCETDIVVKSNIDIYKYLYDKVWNADFPDLKIYDGCNTDSTEYVVRYYDSDCIKLIYGEQEVTFFCPFHKTEEGMAIIYVGYPLLEAKRRKKYALTLHGAAVSIDNKGILLLGKEGAGKTTLALNLCRKYGAKLIGNDLCVLDYCNLGKLRLLGGTSFLNLRYESIKRNLPYELSIFNNKEIKDGWTCKKKVFPEEVGITIANSPVNLSKVYMIHIDQNYSFYHTFEHNVNNVLYINENFSRYIRNTCTSLIIDKMLVGYIPSFDTVDDFILRSNVINFLVQENMEYLSGNLDDVSRYIVNSL